MFDTLSDKQREIVFEREGKFTVRACPGSGKTYSVAARLAHKISHWDKRNQGIATLSFTNVAWQEIESKVNKHFNIRKPIPYPHYLGTIDSFINQFIFLPFGHLIMKCNIRPVLVGEPHGTWVSGRYERDYAKYFENVSYGISDELIYPHIQGIFHFNYNHIYTSNGTESKHAMNLRETKERFWKQGYATQADANYFAMKLTEKFPSITKALIRRFPTFMIDEAQDTSEIQMKIIDTLIENGLDKIILIGDPDQAIFEWNDAKPNLFISKYNEWYENSVTLNDNWRSSQHICDCTFNLSSLEETSCAKNNEVKDFPYKPNVISFNPNNIKDTLEYFSSICEENDIEINHKNVAVLVRSKTMLNTITGTSQILTNDLPWKYGDAYTRDFAKGKYLYDNTDFKQGFKLIEKATYKGFYRKNYCSQAELNHFIDKTGFAKYRENIYLLLKILPDTNCTIGEWIDRANESITNNNIKIELKCKSARRNLLLKEIFKRPIPISNERKFRIGTIHSAKGETFEAVLLVLKKKGIGKNYKTLLEEGVTVESSEELRNVYVAITRPRKILMLAVPDDVDKTAWEMKLLPNN